MIKGSQMKKLSLRFEPRATSCATRLEAIDPIKQTTTPTSDPRQVSNPGSVPHSRVSEITLRPDGLLDSFAAVAQ